MFINPREEDVDLHMYLIYEDLENTCRYNYLGVIIDDKLSFNDFVENKDNKTHILVCQLGKLCNYISTSIASLMYKETIILPLLDYSNFMVESTYTV